MLPVLMRFPGSTLSFLPAVLVATAWLVAGDHLAAQNEAGKIFLDAYLARQKAIEAEEKRDFATAHEKFQEAARLYDRVAREFPGWKPGIVDMRRKDMVERIQGVAPLAAKMEDGQPAGGDPGLPGWEAPARPEVARPLPPSGGLRVRPPAAGASGRDPLAEERLRQMEERQRALEKLLADERREKEALKARLTQVQNGQRLADRERQAAQKAKRKVEEKLAALQEDLVNQEVGQAARAKAMQAEADRLKKELAAAEQRAEEAGRQAEMAAAREAEAQAGEFRRQLAAKDERIEALAVELEAVKEDGRRLAVELEAVKEDGRRLATERDQLVARAEVMEASLRTVTADRDRLRELVEAGPETDLKQLEEDNRQLRRQLAEARGQIRELAAAREELKELADARSKVRELAAAREELRELADARSKLQELDAARTEIRELAAARAKLEKIEEARERDARAMAELRRKLAAVEAELAQVREENAGYLARVEALESQLARARNDLESARHHLASTELVEENRALRQIVVRQLQQQAYRSRARKMLLAELAKLQINSKALLSYIDDMEGRSATPTPEEVARIRDPYIEALSGVGLNAVVFLGDDPPAGDGSPGEAVGAESAPIEGAEDGLPGALAGDPDAADAFEFQKRSLNRTATAAFQAGDFPEAEETFRLIVEADPSDVRARCNLGVAQLRQRKLDEAAATFHEALQAREAEPFAHLMLGVTLWQLDRHAEAIDRLNRSLVLRPDNPQAWLYLGLIALDRSAYADASTALKKAVELDPNLAEGHYNLAVLHTKPGVADPVEARRRYEKAVRLGAARDHELEQFLRLGADDLPMP